MYGIDGDLKGSNWGRLTDKIKKNISKQHWLNKIFIWIFFVGCTLVYRKVNMKLNW